MKLKKNINEIKEIEYNKYWELNEIKIIFNKMMKLWILNWEENKNKNELRYELKEKKKNIWLKLN